MALWLTSYHSTERSQSCKNCTAEKRKKKIIFLRGKNWLDATLVSVTIHSVVETWCIIMSGSSSLTATRLNRRAMVWELGAGSWELDVCVVTDQVQGRLVWTVYGCGLCWRVFIYRSGFRRNVSHYMIVK